MVLVCVALGESGGWDRMDNGRGESGEEDGTKRLRALAVKMGERDVKEDEEAFRILVAIHYVAVVLVAFLE
jgi:hypothetical protein